MFREGEGRVVVRLLRDAEIQAINLEKVSQEQAEIYNDRIKVRNELKVGLDETLPNNLSLAQSQKYS